MENQARRTGLIAEKVGMTQIFDRENKSLAVTLLKVEGNVVLGQKTKARDGYNSVVMGFGQSKPKQVSKSVKGICAKAGVAPTKILREFRVSEDALVAVGEQLDIDHFVVGQSIDIHGINTGKGFAGGMKRHNFRGLEATHGVSVSHRSHGSTGNRQDPGKTFKGKKMAGHLGTETVTIQNVQVVLIDKELGLIAVHGSVPGRRGSLVTLTDAIKLAMPGQAKYPAALVVKESAKKAAPAEQPKEETAAPAVEAEQAENNATN